MKIITRKEAIARKLTRYTGKPCCRGHFGERYTANGRCVECQRLDGLTASYKDNRKRWRKGPKQQERERQYRSSPLGIEATRRNNNNPITADRKRRYKDSPKGIEAKKRELSKPESREYHREYLRDWRLDRSLDTARDDFDPARAQRLLAYAFKREGY